MKDSKQHAGDRNKNKPQAVIIYPSVSVSLTPTPGRGGWDTLDGRPGRRRARPHTHTGGDMEMSVNLATCFWTVGESRAPGGNSTHTGPTKWARGIALEVRDYNAYIPDTVFIRLLLKCNIRPLDFWAIRESEWDAACFGRLPMQDHGNFQ